MQSNIAPIFFINKLVIATIFATKFYRLNGNISRLVGGQAGNGLEDLTGGISESIPLTELHKSLLHKISSHLFPIWWYYIC